MNPQINEDLKRRNKTLCSIFEEQLSIINKAQDLGNTIQGDAKIIAENFLLFTFIALHFWKRYSNFIDFFKENGEICERINTIIKNANGIVRGHSYIVITPNKNIQEIMPVWISLCSLAINRGMQYVNTNHFVFNDLSERLEKRKHFTPVKRYDEFGDEINPDVLDDINYNVYFDVVKYPVGIILNDEENRTYHGNVNNRMIALMEKGKGMIIQTSQPIPFFENQIKIGVENLHILDLRNVANNSLETVNME